MKSKSLVSIDQCTKEDIIRILDNARKFEDNPNRNLLEGKVAATLFFEPSTRTRLSFETAINRLGGKVIGFQDASTTSSSKGETLKDTGKNLQAMSPDLVVIRHSAAGAPKILADALPASIINAGDGAHQHPTQALLDAFTIREKKRRLEGLTVSIIGDISHSRVARSNIACLKKVGARVIVYGPFTMIPYFIEQLGVVVAPTMETAVAQADVIMMLRIQMERQSTFLFPTIREYSTFFGLNLERLKKAKPDVLIMHPGPVNRGVEIAPEVADGPYALILEQVANGVAVRMALLYLLIGR